MPLIVSCDCGKRMRVKDSLAGKRVPLSGNARNF